MTTKQDKDQNMNRNPTGKGGFGDNPQNRNDGRWDKTKSFSYQYNRFMHMTIEELKEYTRQPDSERSVVEDLAYNRVLAAKKSLPDVKEITDRTEGKAPQSIDLTTQGEKVLPVQVVPFGGKDEQSNEASVPKADKEEAKEQTSEKS